MNWWLGNDWTASGRLLSAKQERRAGQPIKFNPRGNPCRQGPVEDGWLSVWTVGVTVGRAQAPEGTQAANQTGGERVR